MNDIDQFPGMSCYHDNAVWDAAESSAFGEPVRLRSVEPYGMIELSINGVWYPCSLSELDTADADAWVESIRALIERKESA